MTVAIILGLLTPLMISIFISVSKYWNTYYGYRGVDFSIDTFMLMGIIEIYYFYQYNQETGYPVDVFFCGFVASCG